MSGRVAGIFSCFFSTLIASVALGYTDGNSPISVVQTPQKKEIVLLGRCNFTHIKYAPSLHYQLVEDINLDGPEYWSPIPLFTGTLDGAGHTMYGLNISETDSHINSGLFRVIRDATITNLGFKNFQLSNSGRATHLGVIAGNCFYCKAINIFCSNGHMNIGGGDLSYSHFATLGIIFGYAKNAYVRFVASNVDMYGKRRAFIGGGIGYADSSKLNGALESINQQGDYSTLGVGAGMAVKKSKIQVSVYDSSQIGYVVQAGIGAGMTESESIVKAVLNDARQRGSGYIGGGTGSISEHSATHAAIFNLSQTVHSKGLGRGFSLAGAGSGYTGNSRVFTVGSHIHQNAEEKATVGVAGGAGGSVNSNVNSMFFRLEQFVPGNKADAGDIGGGVAMDQGRNSQSTINTILHNVTQRAGGKLVTTGGAGGSIGLNGVSNRIKIELLANQLVQNTVDKDQQCGVIGGYVSMCSGSAAVFGDSNKLCKRDKKDTKFGNFPRSCKGSGPLLKYANRTEVAEKNITALGFSDAWDTGSNEQLPILPSLDGIFQDLKRLSEQFAEEIAAYHAPPGHENNSIMSANDWNIQPNRLPFPILMNDCLVKRTITHCDTKGFACFTDSTEPVDCPENTIPPYCKQVPPPPKPTTSSTTISVRASSVRTTAVTTTSVPPIPEPTEKPCPTLLGRPLFQTFDHHSGKIYIVVLQFTSMSLLLARYQNDGALDSQFGKCGVHQWPLPDSIEVPIDATAASSAQTESGLVIELFLLDSVATHRASFATNDSNTAFNFQPFNSTRRDTVVKGLTLTEGKLYYTGSVGDRLLLGADNRLLPADETESRESGNTLLSDDGSLYLAGQKGKELLIRKFDKATLLPDTMFGNDSSLSRSFGAESLGSAMLLDDERLFVAGNIYSPENDLFLLTYTLDGQPFPGFADALRKTSVDSLDAAIHIVTSDTLLYLIKYRGDSNTDDYSDSLNLFTFDREGKQENEDQGPFHFGSFTRVAAHGLALDRIDGVTWFAVADDNDEISVYKLELPYWHLNISTMEPTITPPKNNGNVPIWMLPVAAVGSVLTTAFIAIPLIAVVFVLRKKAQRRSVELKAAGDF